ncbi:MAG: YtxH domain-containing protein [Deltaproteobacteria bacterium]|nr:YtxH domain-containing protein [Deltaproteobacteria bacterium]
MSKSDIVIGVFLGAAAGALLGVLFAPDKGSETRKKINSKGKEIGDELRVKFNEIIDTITEKIDEIKEDAAGQAQKEEAEATE